MCFYPINREVPSALRADEFVLYPLTAAHVQIDYEAVMSSKEMLNLWSGSCWPWPGFTLADNLKDLEWHDKEHQQRVAFTYTVLDTTEMSCLGCVYIRPLADLAADNAGKLEKVEADVAMARFWVRSSRLADGLDVRLLETLREWFADCWAFPRVFFHTRQANKQQVDLFEASGLERVMTLQIAQRGGIFYFYGDDKQDEILD
ncbi:MAG: N-acetyltransferase [Chloroflexi bacterium]|jgi:hypothetical protein|nr:N-acetyltransferase [Chloroflexota bacterium]